MYVAFPICFGMLLRYANLIFSGTCAAPCQRLAINNIRYLGSQSLHQQSTREF